MVHGDTPRRQHLLNTEDCERELLSTGRAVITDMDGWEQIVRVMSVDSFDITTPMDDAETDMVRVEVLVRYQGPNEDQPMDMTTITWIAPN